MTVLRGGDRRRLRRGPSVDVRGDGGTSLIELVVGMAVLSIFLSMFTGAVIMLNQATNKAQAVSLSSLQVNQAYLTLDKTIRYAAAISTPGQCATTSCTTSDWYVEYLTANVSPQRCTQLRVDSQQLQSRSWDPASAPPTPAQFTPLASGITNGVAVNPFTPSTSTLYQQLTIALASQSGSASTQATTSGSSFTFTALNSSVPPTTSSNCLLAGRS